MYTDKLWTQSQNGWTVDAGNPPNGDLIEQFQGLQSLLLSFDDVSALLEEVAILAAAVTPNSSCGITLRRDGQPLTAASSDQRAMVMDETQYQALGGPCLHAMESGEPVVITHVADDPRWPAYMTRARQHGLACSLSLPLGGDDQTLGALNLYGFDGVDVFRGEQRRRCELFAAQASGAMRLATRKTKEAVLRTQLEQAIASRTVIDQALGILMAQQRCTSDQAFALLRLRSQSSQRKLRDIAAELVTRVSGDSPSPGKPFTPS